mmetsp:Transcript_13381/g.23806  ORF Transcript_13381/g.23806 Transcript_13381/m.23806 type:complete len:103 (-) Transcript_13381:261-569(-)
MEALRADLVSRLQLEYFGTSFATTGLRMAERPLSVLIRGAINACLQNVTSQSESSKEQQEISTKVLTNTALDGAWPLLQVTSTCCLADSAGTQPSNKSEACT